MAVPPSGISPSRGSASRGGRFPAAPGPRSRRTPGPASRARRPSGACGPTSRRRRTRCAFRSSDAARSSSAGSRSFVVSSSAARWTADGKTSFEDWPMFTSSLACTSSPASAAITSFAFMFELVPEPVWKTSIGNWSSSSPAATRSRGGGDALGLVRVEQAELGVDARGGGLDPAEPARDRSGNRLAGDGEVLDRLRVSAPQSSCRSAALLIPSPSLAASPCERREQLVPARELTRGRPCGARRARSTLRRSPPSPS